MSHEDGAVSPIGKVTAYTDVEAVNLAVKELRNEHARGGLEPHYVVAVIRSDGVEVAALAVADFSQS
jgi:uncharacterized OB-fold protein